MATNRKAKIIYNKIFEGTDTFAVNTMSNILERRILKKNLPKEPVPKEYAEAYRTYWKKFGLNLDPMWGWYYAARNGIMDVRYVPNDLFFTKIDQHFNSRKLGYGFNDKNYYSKIFSDIKQPKTYVRNFGSGIFCDADYKQISKEEALQIILNNEEVIRKPTQETGSGRDIVFWKPEKDKEEIIEFLNDKNEGDYMIQEVIKQHAELNRIHASSVNTIRVCSILLEDGVHVLSSCLRMGVDNSRVDNISAGGINVGIHEDGSLDDYAYYNESGEKTKVHPQGYVFKGNSVPSYDKIIELVNRAQQEIGHFRLVAWDIAVDEDGEAVLVEANMRKGGFDILQFSNGPIFGDLTDRVMNEVFLGK